MVALVYLFLPARHRLFAPTEAHPQRRRRRSVCSAYRGTREIRMSGARWPMARNKPLVKENGAGEASLPCVTRVTEVVALVMETSDISSAFVG